MGKKKEKNEEQNATLVPHLAIELGEIGATFKVIRNMCGRSLDSRCLTASIEGIDLIAGEAFDRVNEDLKKIHTFYPFIEYKPIEA